MTPTRLGLVLAALGGAVLVLALLLAGLAWKIGAYDCGVQRAEEELEPNAVLRLCAAAGYAPAQAQLGIVYWSASGGEPDFRGRGPSLTDADLNRMGRGWFEAAARKGSAIAQNELGLAHLNGDFGMERDTGRARYWLEEATRGGDEMAPFNLARIHYSGEGVPRSEMQAEAMLRVSVARGYIPARCSLAALLERKGLAASHAEITSLRQMDMRCSEHDLIAGLTQPVRELP